MKSPFPGMDPYLERHWPDVHVSLVNDARNVLNKLLPADLVASAEERVAVGADDDEVMRLYGPDVRVVDQDALDAQADEGAVITAPYRLVANEPMTEQFIRVVEAASERLVTVIEFLSPGHKRGIGLKKFRKKRREMLRARVNFVEVDLVRFGDWKELLLPQQCPRKAISTYRAVVRLPRDTQAAYFYPIFLRQPLPSVVIPLRKDDPELRLELQPLVEAAYQNGRYSQRIDYSKALVPPLPAGDEEWARSVIELRHNKN